MNLTDTISTSLGRLKLSIRLHNGCILSNVRCQWIGSNDKKFQKFGLVSEKKAIMLARPKTSVFRYIRALANGVMSDNIVDTEQA